MLNATDANFDQIISDSKLPVLLDFWATWCQPCKMSMPMLQDIEKQYAGKLLVVKVDADSNPQIAARFGIRGLPTFLVLKNGKPVDTVTGNNKQAVLALVKAATK